MSRVGGRVEVLRKMAWYLERRLEMAGMSWVVEGSGDMDCG